MGRFLAIFSIVIFVLLQVSAMAHESGHDGVPDHEPHDCVLCHGHDRSDDVARLPSTQTLEFLPHFELPAAAFVGRALGRPAYWTAPPGRAPPTFS